MLEFHKRIPLIWNDGNNSTEIPLGFLSINMAHFTEACWITSPSWDGDSMDVTERWIRGRARAQTAFLLSRAERHSYISDAVTIDSLSNGWVGREELKIWHCTRRNITETLNHLIYTQHSSKPITLMN